MVLMMSIPIEVTLVEMVTDVSFTHPWKAVLARLIISDLDYSDSNWEVGLATIDDKDGDNDTNISNTVTKCHATWWWNA